MGNEIAGAGHNIGIGGVAKLNVSDNVRDLPEIDLRLQSADHIAGKALDRHRDSDMRFRLVAKIDSAKESDALLGLNKTRSLGKILIVRAGRNPKAREVDLRTAGLVGWQKLP